MKASINTRETINSLGMQERNFPEFNIGDTIAVSLRIKEGNKERLQVFEGDVIAMHKNGASSTFTVRKIASGSISVERVFPFCSPLVDSIKFVRRGDVRRAKLYYMRDRIGKAARVKEKVLTREQKEQKKSMAAKAAAKAQSEQKAAAPKEETVAPAKEEAVESVEKKETPNKGE